MIEAVPDCTPVFCPQEAGRRAGTENVLGIVGLGAAADIVTAEQQAAAEHMAAMRDNLQQQLLSAFPQVLTISAKQLAVSLHAYCQAFEQYHMAS